MKHARPDYDRFQDPAGLIPKDEPVMLFRGQDKHVAKLVRLYADWVEADGGDPEIVSRCRAHADLMDAWPKKKSPDIGKKTFNEVYDENARRRGQYESKD